MWTKSRNPELFLRFTVHCDLRIAETSLLRITDTEVTPQWTKSIQFASESEQSQLTGIRHILFLKTLAVSIHSSMFHAATGKGRHITGCSLCIIRTPPCCGHFGAWSCGVHNLEVPVYMYMPLISIYETLGALGAKVYTSMQKDLN